MEKICLTPEELNALVARADSGQLQEGDAAVIRLMANAIVTLSQAVNGKSESIKRLLAMLFGAKTEKKRAVLKTPPSNSGDRGRQKARGHGKNSAKNYTGADRIPIPHEELKPGDPCPLCPKGKVYRQKQPGIVLCFEGQAPLKATLFELEKLRCNLCGMVFTASAPDNKSGREYDPSAMAIIVLFKYGHGLPWNRLERLQAGLGVPLPATTQWEKSEESANLVYPAFDELVRQAAQGDIFHNDDTVMRVLALMKENNNRTGNERTGIFTTAIVSKTADGRQIAIFHTGRNHAGENIALLYGRRNEDKALPIQMCDASSRNVPSDFDVILCNCLTHARRNFVHVHEHFPDESRRVIEVLSEVYHIDAVARRQEMTLDQRLTFHQENSSPKMAELKSWLDTQVEDKLVEPNCGLGKAIAYMRNHWMELTQFLRVPGAPLDNNLCERSLKRCILHRKNSLFYRTEHGAYIGDMFMSLIHSCVLMRVNPMDYLETLMKNSAKLFKDPSQWMPWNYKAAVT